MKVHLWSFLGLPICDIKLQTVNLSDLILLCTRIEDFFRPNMVALILQGKAEEQ